MEEDADESQNVDEMDDDAEESYPLQFVCDAIKLIRGLKLQNIEDPVIRRELIHLNYIIETSIQRRGVNQNAGDYHYIYQYIKNSFKGINDKEQFQFIKGYVQEMPKTYINHPVKKIQEYLNKVSEGITLDNSPQVTFSRILIAAYASASKSLATDIQLTSCLSTLEVIDVVLSTQQQKLQQKFKSFFVSYLNTEIKRVSKEFAINMKSEDNKKDHIFVHKLPGLTFTRDVNDRIEKVRIKKMLEKETETRIAKDRKIARTAKQFGQQDIMQRRQNQK
ncbi:hypothetical protein OXYTRIMIC_441 [Oxytricha trifallax]|uniref:Uncharacterized protein n=1 Tax=Oxytricha trifallax TaxID=1172189 RepID=A0A073IB93_9SPIT|nr:hypothetical protein OXYTRIMIC_441 [Oxytricha trifallax]